MKSELNLTCLNLLSCSSWNGQATVLFPWSLSTDTQKALLTNILERMFCSLQCISFEPKQFPLNPSENVQEHVQHRQVWCDIHFPPEDVLQPVPTTMPLFMRSSRLFCVSSTISGRGLVSTSSTMLHNSLKTSSLSFSPFTYQNNTITYQNNAITTTLPTQAGIVFISEASGQWHAGIRLVFENVSNSLHFSYCLNWLTHCRRCLSS